VPSAICVGSVENAAVGVSVDGGGSGVGVSVEGIGVGVKAAAVSVNSATTVYAAEVRITSTSGVGTMGVAGAQADRINAAVNTKMVSLAFICPLLIYYPILHKIIRRTYPAGRL